jgi:colanic acid biosynthesis glycosyl transferase WcaI
LTHSFRENLVTRGVPTEKIDVVENGIDEELFCKERAAGNAREAMEIEDNKFLAGYIGTVGMAHGLETLVEAAELCKDHSHIQFLIIGEGAERAKLEMLASKKGLSNITFMDFVPRDQMPSYLASLDVFIVHLKSHPVFREVIPSKIFESMAMGIPLVHAVEGESAAIVEQSGSGICIPSGNALTLAQAVINLSADRERCANMGRLGRQFVTSNYSRRAKAEALMTSLKRAVDSERS